MSRSSENCGIEISRSNEIVLHSGAPAVTSIQLTSSASIQDVS